MATAGSLPSGDQLLCSICLDVFTHPVSLSCGHNFCKACITDCWNSAASGLCQCPMCKETFNARPQLHVNCLVSEMADRFRRSVRVKEEQERDSRTCQKHNKILEFFCRDEQRCICVLCSQADHRGHDVVALAENNLQVHPTPSAPPLCSAPPELPPSIRPPYPQTSMFQTRATPSEGHHQVPPWTCSSQQRHPNADVTCDGCGRDLSSANHYHCTFCPDYDLCTGCFSAGCHREHVHFLEKVFGSEPSADGGPICDGCDRSLSSARHYHCTFCPDYDLCTACYSAGCHREHTDFLHKVFESGPSADIGAICDGCDRNLSSARHYHCTFCPDYDLCTACYSAGIHREHIGFLKEVFGSEPSADIGAICDGCDRNLSSARHYHCTLCPDYDLCTACFSAGCHGEHVNYLCFT